MIEATSSNDAREEQVLQQQNKVSRKNVAQRDSGDDLLMDESDSFEIEVKINVDSNKQDDEHSNKDLQSNISLSYKINAIEEASDSSTSAMEVFYTFCVESLAMYVITLLLFLFFVFFCVLRVFCSICSFTCVLI